MDRGGLAPETRPVPLHDDVDPGEDLPEPPSVDSIVGVVVPILREGDGVRDLLGQLGDGDGHSEVLQPLHDLLVEVGNVLAAERDALHCVVAGSEDELVIDEVEFRIEAGQAMGNRRRGQAARGEIQANIGPLGLEGRLRDAQLSDDDLRVHVQRCKGVAPILVRESRPRFQ